MCSRIIFCTFRLQKLKKIKIMSVLDKSVSFSIFTKKSFSSNAKLNLEIETDQNGLWKSAAQLAESMSLSSPGVEKGTLCRDPQEASPPKSSRTHQLRSVEKPPATSTG